MRVLVVGGAGYIGSVVSEHLIEAGHDVVVLDNLHTGHRAAVPSSAAFIEGDMGCDADLAKAFAKQPDAVMHFAALSLVGDSVKEPAIYYQNNVVNGLRLLDQSLAHKVNRFVFSSTAAVYGEPPNNPILEDFPLAPTSAYGDTKLAFERMLAAYAKAYGLRYASLRYFNAAGATNARGEDHVRETHLIPLLLDVAQNKMEHATIFGDDYATPDGTCVRDYIHVSDLAQAHILALNALDDHAVQIYNLGSEHGYSVKEVVNAVRKVTGHAVPTKIGPRRAGDPVKLVASSAKIRANLGWVPERDGLAQIIADAWQWQSQFPNGYEDEKVAVK